MSWVKKSAEAGLGGLTEQEAAVGALFNLFEGMPDPLVVSLQLSLLL